MVLHLLTLFFAFSFSIALSQLFAAAAELFEEPGFGTRLNSNNIAILVCCPNTRITLSLAHPFFHSTRSLTCSLFLYSGRELELAAAV